MSTGLIEIPHNNQCQWIFESIDCFEVFLEKPSYFLAKAQSYSVYKHHQTVKYLIGIILLHETVCFISDGWGGRVSETPDGKLEYSV